MKGKIFKDQIFEGMVAGIMVILLLSVASLTLIKAQATGPVTVDVSLSQTIVLDASYASIAFPSLDLTEWCRTTDQTCSVGVTCTGVCPGGDCCPFVLRNDGSAQADVTIITTATDDVLWDSQTATAGSTYFRFSVGTASTGETGCYDEAGSQTSFANIPLSGGTTVLAVDNLKFWDTEDEADLEIYLEVPAAEAGGSKSAEILLTGNSCTFDGDASGDGGVTCA